MSDEKLISKEQTVSQKVRQELFKEMSDTPKQNFDRAHIASNYCISQNGHLLCKQHLKNSQRKYSVNTLAPYLILGCNNNDLIMEPDISKLEVHAVEHDLPGGGNATTQAVCLYQRIQALLPTVKYSRYRSFNFKFLKYYYYVSYSEED